MEMHTESTHKDLLPYNRPAYQSPSSVCASAWGLQQHQSLRFPSPPFDTHLQHSHRLHPLMIYITNLITNPSRPVINRTIHEHPNLKTPHAKQKQALTLLSHTYMHHIHNIPALFHIHTNLLGKKDNGQANERRTQ